VKNMVKSFGAPASHANLSLLFLTLSSLVAGHAAETYGQSIRTDPGHKEFAEVGGVRVSSPKNFAIQPQTSNEPLYIRHDQYDLGILVAVPDKRIDDEYVRSLASLGATCVYAAEAARYKWKRLENYQKVSSFEVGGGQIQGFNGQQRVMLDYRTLKVGGKEVVVGYVFGLGRGAEAKALFARNLGGMSMPGWYALAHIIASITGEKYDKINPPDSFIAVPLKKQ
jgi:hypothetical protein